MYNYPLFGLITIVPYFPKDAVVQVCDLQDKGNFDELRTSDVLAFTCFASQLKITRYLIEYARKNLGRPTKFVVGGPGVISNPDYARSILGYCVELVAGDGEYFAKDLPSSLEADIYRSKFFNFDEHLIPAEGILAATEKYDKPDPINLGTGKEITIKQIVWDTTRPDGQPRRCLDASRAKNEFDFEAKTDLTLGIKKTIEWYKNGFRKKS